MYLHYCTTISSRQCTSISIGTYYLLKIIIPQFISINYNCTYSNLSFHRCSNLASNTHSAVVISWVSWLNVIKFCFTSVVSEQHHHRRSSWHQCWSIWSSPHCTDSHWNIHCWTKLHSTGQNGRGTRANGIGCIRNQSHNRLRDRS